jgi:hypothetical protein
MFLLTKAFNLVNQNIPQQIMQNVHKLYKDYKLCLQKGLDTPEEC